MEVKTTSRAKAGTKKRTREQFETQATMLSSQPADGDMEMADKKQEEGWTIKAQKKRKVEVNEENIEEKVEKI